MVGKYIRTIIIATTYFTAFLYVSIVYGQEFFITDFLNASQKKEFRVQDGMDSSLRSARAAIANTSQNAIVISALVEPRVARFIRTPREPGLLSEWCTAVLVSRTSALTAAHCVCDVGYVGNPVAFSQCDVQSNMRQFSYSLIFPAFGLRQVDKIYVNPKYIRPNTSKFTEGQNYPVADIAIVHFDLEILAEPLAVASFDPSGTFTLASFGSFGTSSSPRWLELGLDINTDYEEGLGHIAKLNNPTLLAPGLCEGEASDTFCQRYDPGSSVAGSTIRDDTTPCGGDSGSPLFLSSEGDASRLVGIASYINPPQGDCATTTNRTANFVALDAYADWIKATAGVSSPPVPSLPLYCGEQTLRVKDTEKHTILYHAEPGILTVQSTGQGSRPDIELKSGAMNCSKFDSAGAITCVIKSSHEFMMKVEGQGLIQISLCQQIER